MKKYHVSIFDLLENKPYTFLVKSENDEYLEIIKKALKEIIFPDGFVLNEGDSRTFDQFFKEETRIFLDFIVISVIQTESPNLCQNISFKEIQ